MKTLHWIDRKQGFGYNVMMQQSEDREAAACVSKSPWYIDRAPVSHCHYSILLSIQPQTDVFVTI